MMAGDSTRRRHAAAQACKTWWTASPRAGAGSRWTPGPAGERRFAAAFQQRRPSGPERARILTLLRRGNHLLEQSPGHRQFVVTDDTLQAFRQSRDRLAPNRQRRVPSLQTRIEVALLAWIEGGEVGSVVRAPALPAFERAPECGLRRSEPRPQIEHVLQLEPSFLSGTNVDGLRGFRELLEFPQAIPHPGLIAHDPTVLPHQISQGALKGTCH